MVMRNRHDGGGPDELPPRLRDRLAGRPRYPDPFDAFDAVPHTPPDSADAPPGPPPAAGLGRLALLFLAVGVANTLFLLVALSFVAGGPAPAILMPGR